MAVSLLLLVLKGGGGGVPLSNVLYNPTLAKFYDKILRGGGPTLEAPHPPLILLTDNHDSILRKYLPSPFFSNEDIIFVVILKKKNGLLSMCHLWKLYKLYSSTKHFYL
jgi:hypothetical protein